MQFFTNFNILRNINQWLNKRFTLVIKNNASIYNYYILINNIYNSLQRRPRKSFSTNDLAAQDLYFLQKTINFLQLLEVKCSDIYFKLDLIALHTFFTLLIKESTKVNHL